MIYSRELFQKRRRAVQDQMNDDALTLVFSAPARLKSLDVFYPFRQNSDFFYLSGFTEENSILVITKHEVRIYLQPKDQDAETWTGKRMGTDAAVEILGVDTACDVQKFKTDIGELLQKKSELYYHYGCNAEEDRLIFSTVERLIRTARRGNYAPEKILHPSLLLHEMRLIKSSEEIEQIKVNASIAARAHQRIMTETRPGMNECELEAILEYEFRRHGAIAAYPSIVASGDNSCILHYVENNQEIQDGDLILVDAGAEKNFMNVDITRTFPAGETFNPAQRDIYQLVLLAQKNAISAAVVGANMEDINRQTIRILCEGMIDIGLLEGPSEAAIEQKTYRRYFMHGTGHWLGMDVHDVGAYYQKGKARSLQDGMICTIEPGIYIRPEEESAPEECKGIGVRIEDDILIQISGPLNLTAAIPKEISDIEALRQSQ